MALFMYCHNKTNVQLAGVYSWLLVIIIKSQYSVFPFIRSHSGPSYEFYTTKHINAIKEAIMVVIREVEKHFPGNDDFNMSDYLVLA